MGTFAANDLISVHDSVFKTYVQPMYISYNKKVIKSKHVKLLKPHTKKSLKQICVLPIQIKKKHF